MPDLDLVQGTLDLLILRALNWDAMHGYAVARWIRERTRDDLVIEEGALYTALHRMERRGWLESTWGVSENNRRAKFYAITKPGRKHLTDESARWSRYVLAVGRVLHPEPAR